MMKISVWNGDMSDSYLRTMTQLGVDCLDFGDGGWFPGVAEQGYPDLDELLKIRRRVRSWGLDINRVTLPNITEAFMRDQEGGERELENSTRALQVFAEAGVPIARQRVGDDTFPWMNRRYVSVHRGGYQSRGESLALTEEAPGPLSPEELERWQRQFRRAYEAMVPVAEAGGIKLAIHPSDTPNIDTPLGGLGFHRVIDMFPSRNVGYLYCCGTRAQAGGSALVLDEIHNYGRKGRIFMVHLRAVRGSLATAGGFEEVLLDDGDTNMVKFLRELQQVGFDGCVNPDHIPALEGDSPQVSQGLAYSVGYIKAALAALAIM
jgi:mannonate dehydratase